MLRVTDSITIADRELTEHFVRASGPGGQNVNKVSTAVELRFQAGRSSSLSATVRARLRRLAGRRWTREGALVIQVDATRSQSRNRDIARERLAGLIRKALESPVRRRDSGTPVAARERRLTAKKTRAAVKFLRARVDHDHHGSA